MKQIIILTLLTLMSGCCAGGLPLPPPQNYPSVSQDFTGTGTNFTDTVRLYPGQAIIEIQYEWSLPSEHFAVYLRRNDGAYVPQGLLVNAMTMHSRRSQPVNDRKLIRIRREADFRFAVETRGSGRWYITINQGS